jgi:asparagine synthase (glutamine-hydrolysing)
MCGIAGIIRMAPGKELLSPAINRMTNQMKRRGPDDEGYLLVDLAAQKIQPYYGNDTAVEAAHSRRVPPEPHIKSAYGTQSHIAFGHRRLNIIDLSFDGHQPMASPDGTCWLIFNGEIYNYKEIRRQLKQCGHSFISQSDTEVVLAAYLEWGMKGLQRMNGMFAFAIYDQRESAVYLVRDRIGIKPLYYTRQKDNLIFASDIKTIISSGLYTPAMDLEGLWHNLSFSITPRPMTLFSDVYALPQAHWMRIDLKSFNVSQHRYWQVPIGTQDHGMSEADAVEQLQQHLTRSIQYRLTADVEVGTFMSGGIDSTTISAIASGLHPGINAFTLAFSKEVPEYDETDQAVETALMHPMNHILEKVDPVLLLADINDMVISYEEPIATLAPNHLISRCVSRHGIVVVLNGLGGDELFAGYDHYLAVRDWKWKRAAAMFFPSSMPHHHRYRRLKTIGQYYADWFSNFREHDKKRLFPNGVEFDSLTHLDRLYEPVHGRFSDNIEALSYYDLLSYIGNHHVYRLDQFTMRFSLEGRFPFLDHELVEFAFRIPNRYKINQKVQKLVLRKVAEKFIAPSCLSMPKRGFGLPVGRWMKEQLGTLTEISLEQLKDRGIFNADEIDRLYTEFQQGSPLLYKKVWHLVMIELWHQYFIDDPKSILQFRSGRG